jgi:hypothetical protein
MNLVDTNGYLTWLSQSDGRIKVTDPNVQIWADALTHATPTEVRQATHDHYRTNETAPTPAGIRRLTYAIRERAAAVRSALEAGPTIKTPNTYRQRHPELWDHLFNEGRAAGNAERARHTTNRNAS